MTADAGQLSSMHDVFTRYRLEVVPTKSPSNQKANISALQKLDAFCGRMRPCDVRPRHGYQFRDERGMKARIAANRDLEVFKHVFTKAIEWGAVDANPLRDVRKFPEKPRDRYVTDLEFQLVHDVAPPMIQVAMDLALLTGLRRRDILDLTRTNLTDDGILVRPSKTENSTGKVLLIEWSAELRTVIDRAKKLPPHVRQNIVATRHGKPYSSDGFSSMWNRTMAKALKAGLREKWRFNDLRAKSASDDTLNAAVERLGHSNAATTKRFYRRGPEKVRPLR